jgi:hypothetical protein
MVDKRVLKNSKSIIALNILLLRIGQSPTEFTQDIELVSALQSQGALSKLHRPTDGILLSSLNTLKKAAQVNLLGGFFELEENRKHALFQLNESLVATKKARSKSCKSQQAAKINEMKHTISVIREDLFLMTGAINSLAHLYIAACKGTNDPDATIRCQKELRVIFAGLTLRKIKDSMSEKETL